MLLLSLLLMLQKYSQKCRMLLAILCRVSKARAAIMFAVPVDVFARGGVHAFNNVVVDYDVIEGRACYMYSN
jgi:hypothetical protein